ncbi:hypothetical protein Bbelb_278610 [Branchiostoma belcheri]|nr:hypothetical protein Bbelb_278610 [Branchiostoma belcheri]
MSLHRASQIQNALLLIGGDFNLPGWDWSSTTLKPSTPYPGLHQDFLDILQDNGLEQLVKEPTREDNTLDLLVTNNPNLVPRVEIVPGLSDHNIPYCEINTSNRRKKQTQRTIPLFAKADWDSLRSEATKISIEVQDNCDNMSTEELWTTFKDSLTAAVKNFIPHKTTRTKINLPWVTPSIRKLMNRRDRKYRKWKKNGSNKLREEVKALRRTIQRQIRRSYWSHLNSVFTEETSAYKPGNKRFWAYVKNQRSSNAGVAPLKKDGRLTSNPQEQADILNEHFQSVFSDGQQYSNAEFEEKTGMQNIDVPAMDNITITCEGVSKLMEKLNPHKAGGPDGISPRILRELAEELAPALTTIFKSSLTTGSVPTDWRSAYVMPIFKKGEQYDPTNYRPISLTCIACKLMEHIVVKHVMYHLESHAILNDAQHGFRRGRSCESQLLEMVEELTTNVESGKQTDILIMDFAKAFDRVNHSLLIHKLHRLGIQGSTLAWIESFLRDRRQAVIVDGYQSSYASVRSGVPQGSVLGPCLFLAYINDLPDKLTALARLFADDTAMYNVITNREQQDQLQRDLERLADWEKSWDMMFHPAKCVTMTVTRSRKPLETSYVLHGHTLETVRTAKYLGVSLCRDASWNVHYNNVANKANGVLCFIKRNLKISSVSIKEKAYKTFVRPLLEYASSVWDPYKQKDIDKLESIQRRAARYVLNRYHNTSSVTNMLAELGWQPLAERRRSARLGMLAKINQGIVQCPIIKSKLVPPPSRRRRTHNYQLSQIKTRTQYRDFSFLPRTIKDWNAAEVDTVNNLVSSLM